LNELTGRIVFGISGTGKSHLIKSLGHPPNLLDADELVSSNHGPGFPEVDEWWNVLSEDELQAFGDTVYRFLAPYAVESWILTGIGPVPTWVWGLLRSKGIPVSFIVITKDQLARNLELRAASGNTSQPSNLEEVWSAYQDFLSVAAEQGVDLVPYNRLTDLYRKETKKRRSGRIEVKSVFVQGEHQHVAFTWQSHRIVHDVQANKSTVVFRAKGRPPKFDLSDGEFRVIPLSDDQWPVLARKASKSWQDFLRSL